MLSPKEARTLVANALRSGKYKQGQNALHRVEQDTYCCLGVACEVFIENGGPLTKERVLGDELSSTLTSYDTNNGLLPAKVQSWLGISGMGSFVTPIELPFPNGKELCTSLISANDHFRAPFNVIADLIEQANFRLPKEIENGT